MSRPAKIIFLHGPSSSGKSTLARALQDHLPEPFWHVSIDHLRDAGIVPMERFRRGDFVWRDHRAAFFEGFHRSLQAYAGAGNNLILEHILDTAGWREILAEIFAPFDLFVVGIHCDLPELVRRELARGDRPIGSAEQDFHTVHSGMHYDLQVRSEDGPGTNVTRILDAWSHRPARSAFLQATLS